VSMSSSRIHIAWRSSRSVVSPPATYRLGAPKRTEVASRGGSLRETCV
jgi:hypothetical protein